MPESGGRGVRLGLCERQTDTQTERKRKRMRDSGSELLHPGRIYILDSR